jgi:L-aspartate oxidase
LLLDERGERFIDELGPRSVVARAILERGRVVLDARAIPDLEVRFPTVVAAVRAHGLDPVTEAIPVEPAAHYFIGGVAADAHGRTSLDGLLAAGEAASTGFDGANRMAGNSLLQAVVVGRRVGAQVTTGRAPSSVAALEGPGLSQVPADLPELLWAAAGPIRDDAGLAAGLDALAERTPSAHLRFVAMILTAARARTETRGVHTRRDFPDPDRALAQRRITVGAAEATPR